MSASYNKCKKFAVIILDESIPTMQGAYKQFVNNMKDEIQFNDCLNKSRKYTKYALASLQNHKNSNSDVRRNLNRLKDLDYEITQQSRYLHDLLRSVAETFAKKKKKISQQVNNIINEIANSTIPAPELEVKLKKLGKEIQQITNEEIPGYKNKLRSFINKVEKEICDNTTQAYRKISKTEDSKEIEIFSMVGNKVWTDIPNEFLRTSGAYVHESYK